LPHEPEWARSNWQSYCVRLPDRVDQKTMMQNLLDKGIATRRGIMCAHREAPYANNEQRHDLRQSELAQDHSILLPISLRLPFARTAAIRSRALLSSVDALPTHR
jgi:perosamine synthetase